jgi:hypothetical protein
MFRRDLDWNMFAFLSWLERNKEAHTLNGLTIKDGYGWYNEQWKCWLKNSDAGKQVQSNPDNDLTWYGINTYRINKVEDNNPGTMMSPTDVENERFKYNAGGYNPSVREKDNTTGETTIEFPKQHQPEQYNPNKPSLDTMTFRFEQEENCIDGGEGETLIVEAKSSLGIDGDGGAFYVLKTEQWAINEIDDLIVMLKRVEAALDATKPTTIHK